MFQVDAYTQSLIDDYIKTGNTAPKTIIEVDRMVFNPTGTPPQELFELYTDMPEAYSLNYVTSGSSSTVSQVTSTCDYPIFPVQGYTVTTATVADAFGTFEYWRWRTHEGVDFDVPVGSSVLSAWDGIVTHVGQDGVGYGTFIDVYHGSGLKTRYGHLKDSKVNVGQTVKKGDVLGTTGVAGLMSANLFHFEIQTGCPARFGAQINGTPHDPMPYLENKLCARSINTTASGVTSTIVTNSIDGQAVAFYTETFATNPIGYGNEADMLAKFGHYVNTIGNVPFDYGAKNGRKCAYADYVYTKFTRAESGYPTTLEVEVEFKGDGYFDFSFATNLANNGKETLSAYIDGQVVWTYAHPQDNWMWQSGRLSVKGAGKHVIWFTWTNSGVSGAGVAVTDFVASYVNPADKLTGSSLTLNETLFNYRKPTNQPSIGSFTYKDTLTISDDVIDVEVQRSIDFKAVQVTITLNNASNLYTPFYDPSTFNLNDLTSNPWVMNINGEYIGVISKNTPIRIWLGYGEDGEVRMFTGLIGKVENISEQKQVQITCYDMYQLANDRVLYLDRTYPPIDSADAPKSPWLVSAVVEDLLNYAGLVGWRKNPHEQQYPDFFIQDTVIVEEVPATGQFIKNTGDFGMELANASNYTTATAGGYVNPFVFLGGYDIKKGTKVSDAIQQALQNTNFIITCNRYGTIVSTTIPYNQSPVKTIRSDEIIETLTVTEDYTNARNHLIVSDGVNYDHFLDADLMGIAKNELLSAGLQVEWAITRGRRQVVADRAFYDIKRICRTVRITILGDPTLDVYDTIEVVDETISLRKDYTIKAITDHITKDKYEQTLDLMWH